MANRLAVRFTEPSAAQSRHAAAAQLSLTGSFPVPLEKFTIYRVPSVAPMASPAAANRIARAAADRADVDRVAPVYALGPHRAVVTDRLIVGIRDERALAGLADLGLTVVERFPGGVLLRAAPGADPQGLLSRAGAVPGVTFAEPDLVVIGRSPDQGTGIAASAAERPALGIGYAATLTGLVAARQRLTGSPAVAIAVLDDGIDSNHPDLRRALAGTFDATTGATAVPGDTWNEHGTACAGLAAGAGQVEGFGHGCSLLAVRIARSDAPHSPWVTASSYLRRGIDWAASRAAVLSLSWGGTVVSSAVADAIARARATGRGGLGCVIVAAAGNSPGPVDFPASLPEVLAVSGSNGRDQFKTPVSSDGETWWGSASGSEVDLAAPAVQIRTTGLRGAAGDTADDYLPAFNGTSAATPMVAGTAALLISALRNATEDHVRALLLASTDKIGGQPYVGGRNDLFGAGRLNVDRAVRAALGMLPPTPQQGGNPMTSANDVPPGEVRLPLRGAKHTSSGTEVPPELQVHLGGSAAPRPAATAGRTADRSASVAGKAAPTARKATVAKTARPRAEPQY